LSTAELKFYSNPSPFSTPALYLFLSLILPYKSFLKNHGVLQSKIQEEIKRAGGFYGAVQPKLNLNLNLTRSKNVNFV
ncbi:hypothetical protein, partial [Helicobacter ailurogastricus]|uniref:hypothetical protein n=1 Tax=Helicobacter ailurogastricus TaxID=1578720 RepID=UPI002557B67E